MYSNLHTAAALRAAAVVLRMLSKLFPTRDDVVCHVLRDGIIVVKFHRHASATLGHRAERRGVAEHFRERHLGVDHFVHTALFHALYLRTLARCLLYTSPSPRD